MASVSEILVCNVVLLPNCGNVSITGNKIYNVGAGSAGHGEALVRTVGIWCFTATPGLYMSGNYIYDDQPVPTMGFSLIGATGAGCAIVGNFFDRPYLQLRHRDLVMAIIIGTNAWIIGGLTGTDAISAVNASVGHRASLQYQANYVSRWLIGTDGSPEPGCNFGSNFIITRIAVDGTPTDVLTLRRDVSEIIFAPDTRLSSFLPQVMTNSAGVSRWFMGNFGDADEGTPGSNIGSDFVIVSANDDGSDREKKK